ncbi:hypothetical protein Bbelb_226590 [Branchiostoma belcheri]|nr:hypothetical protein Bbelb_226590 [Branchiostoma belcheri]
MASGGKWAVFPHDVITRETVAASAVCGRHHDVVEGQLILSGESVGSRKLIGWAGLRGRGHRGVRSDHSPAFPLTLSVSSAGPCFDQWVLAQINSKTSGRPFNTENRTVF